MSFPENKFGFELGKEKKIKNALVAFLRNCSPGEGAAGGHGGVRVMQSSNRLVQMLLKTIPGACEAESE